MPGSRCVIWKFADTGSSVIATHDKGTILCIPRERNMTRLYIELSSGTKDTSTSKENEELVKRQAKEIMAPFIVEWKSVEWFGVYRGMFHRITENSRTKRNKKIPSWSADSYTIL